MRFGLETTDAWLSALSSTWKRVGSFWFLVAGVGTLSSLAPDSGHDIGDVLQLGGLTYVLTGPVFFWSALVAAVVWIRFVHLENAGTRSFLLLGILIAINGALDERSLMTATLVGLQVLSMLLIILTLLISRPAESRGRNSR